MPHSFYSNGKLLITGEYAVLDGALSLALPTSFGQSLSVQEINSFELRWRSLDKDGKVWFENTFDLNPAEKTSSGQSIFTPNLNTGQDRSSKMVAIAETLSKILREAQALNPEWLNRNIGYSVETKLSFPRDWGLGSSSTLINNIAQWAEVDAYQLLWNAFTGSGYDIACAQKYHPIAYRLNKGKPIITEIDFNPTFQDHLYFIHLNKKQSSREGIATYRKKNFDKTMVLEKVSGITEKTIVCKSLSEFETLMNQHETLLSQSLGMPTVKETLF
ncbi:hypothetical protein LCGC14_2403160, partial [marine sediment metagenome]